MDPKKWLLLSSLLSMLHQASGIFFPIERRINGDTFKPPSTVPCSDVKGAVAKDDGYCECNANQPTVHFLVNNTTKETTLACFANKEICPDCYYGGVASFGIGGVFKFNRTQLFHDAPSDCINPSFTFHTYFLGLWFEPGVMFKGFNSSIIEAELDNKIIDYSGSLVYLSLHCRQVNKLSHVLFKVNGTGRYPPCTVSNFCNHELHVLPTQRLQKNQTTPSSTTTQPTTTLTPPPPPPPPTTTTTPITPPTTTATQLPPTTKSTKITLERRATGDKLLDVANCSSYQGTMTKENRTCVCSSATPTFHFQLNGSNETLGCFRNQDLCTDCHYIGMSSILLESNNAKYLVIPDDFTKHLPGCEEVKDAKIFQYFYGYWFWEKVEFSGFKSPLTKIPSSVGGDEGLIIKMEVQCTNNATFHYVSKLNGEYYYRPGANRNTAFQSYVPKTETLITTTTSAKTTKATTTEPTTTATTTTAPTTTHSTFNATVPPSPSNITTTLPEEEPVFVARYIDGDRIYPKNILDCQNIAGADFYDNVICFCDRDRPTLHFNENKSLGCYKNKEVCPDCQDLGVVWAETPLSIVVPEVSNETETCQTNISNTRLLLYSTIGFWPYHEVDFEGFKSPRTKIMTRFPVEEGALMRLEVFCDDNKIYKYLFKLNGTFWYTEGYLSSAELHIDNLVPPEEHNTTITASSTTTTTSTSTTSSTTSASTASATTSATSSTICKTTLEFTTTANSHNKQQTNDSSKQEENFHVEEVLIPLVAVVFVVILSAIVLLWYKKKKFRYPRRFAMQSISIKTLYSSEP